MPMTTEQCLNLIKAHNASVDFIGTLHDVNVPVDVLMALMPLSSKFSSESLVIVELAHESGINAKVDMQSGHISYPMIDNI